MQASLITSRLFSNIARSRGVFARQVFSTFTTTSRSRIVYSTKSINGSSFIRFESTKITAAPSKEYIQQRLKLWDEEKQRQSNALKSESLTQSFTIHLTFQNTKHTITLSPENASTAVPIRLLADISKDLADNALIASVNGTTYEINRSLVPLLLQLQKNNKNEVSIVFYSFDSPEGQNTFWHSSAHVLGQALEQVFDDVELCDGPALTEGGFFYEFFMGKSMSTENHKSIEDTMNKILKKRQNFERMTVSKEFALKMFEYNRFKKQILESIPDGDEITLYRSGEFVDLCRGPHLQHTGKIKARDLSGAVSVLRSSGTYWKGDSSKELLQRVYAISFPEKAGLDKYLEQQEAAKQRDHRLLGRAQELFMFDALSPGNVFFLPHGTRIFNKLLSFLRNEYRARGYEEVITPLIFNTDLWKKSGHYANYKEDMFTVIASSHKKGESDTSEYMLKPMNCPGLCGKILGNLYKGHCMMFKHRARSYRELPVRYADFGVLHRNELSGALTGLTRVRRFQQDDAHIFCRHDQIKSEIEACMQFMKHVYGIFGFQFKLELSTRPTNYLGEIEVWDKAESELKEALQASFGDNWKLNPGDGAFYGPKIDVHITDAIGRSHQCATIQLDFQLPIRFDLSYQTESNSVYERPVIIHRAILGSVERMMGILIEHTAGKWPFWISPRQVMILPVSQKYNEYAQQVKSKILEKGYFVDVDDADSKQLQRKIRDSQLAQYNYILVVGHEEVENQTVNVRTRDGVVHGSLSLSQLLDELKTKTEQFQ